MDDQKKQQGKVDKSHCLQSEDDGAGLGIPYDEQDTACLELLYDGFAILSPQRGADQKIGDFRYEYINSAGCTLIGRPCSEIIGRTLSELHPSYSLEKIFADYIRLTETGQSGMEITCDFSRVLDDGKEVIQPVKIRVAKTGAGLAVTWRELSEHEQAQSDLEIRTRQLEVLYSTSLEVNSQQELPALLSLITERATRLIGAEMGGLYLVRPDGKSLEMKVRYDLPAHDIGSVMQIGEGLSGRVLESGELIVVEDYMTWDQRARVFDGLPFHRSVGIPLKIRNRVIGVINITDRIKVGKYTEEEIQLVSLFADQAAIAVENARLYEWVQSELVERKRVEENLRFMATHDPLTQLPNRALFRDRLLQAIKRAYRREHDHHHKWHGAVMLLDLDHFKLINDTYGHPMGDQLLKIIADRLLQSVRQSDTVARMGGDEFTLILEEISGVKDAGLIANKILSVLTKPVLIDNARFIVSGSIGISLFPEHGDDVDVLLKRADIAMYQAKEQRNRYQFFEMSCQVQI